MKEQLLKAKNERGYFLPFVIFVALIIFSSITTTTIIYRNELYIANRLKEQMKSETIVQMSKRKFLIEQPHIRNNVGTVTYEFPYGKSTISYEKIDENNIHVHLLVVTDNQHTFSFNIKIE